MISLSNSSRPIHYQLNVVSQDDVLTKKGFVSTMKRVAVERLAAQKSWFMIDFCKLGFIGKLFKSRDLPWLVQFLLMFYNDQPVDWILADLLRTITGNNNRKTNETGM